MEKSHACQSEENGSPCRMGNNDAPVERLRISQGAPTAFLVYDDSLCHIDAPFFQWMKKEGFVFAGRYGGQGHYDNCKWVYLNITRKVFAYGMPFIPVVTAVGNHAIKIEEFKTIYAIYKKYEGKRVLQFDEK